MRPFSVVRALSAATIVQFCGSVSDSGFAQDSDAYRVGLKAFIATTEIGLEVTPTHASPLRTSCAWEMAQPMFRSNRFDGLSGSRTAVRSYAAASPWTRRRKEHSRFPSRRSSSSLPVIDSPRSEARHARHDGHRDGAQGYGRHDEVQKPVPEAREVEGQQRVHEHEPGDVGNGYVNPARKRQ